MQENWFPKVNADIFISHSHSDRDTAIILAGILKKAFNIDSFIDSCVWGYSDELLREIDNQYCLQPDGYYNYQKRNFSTAHIHMMLSTALNMMIDNTECLFFLNTKNSVSTSGIISKTESPWIYSEIATSKVIRRRDPIRFNKRSIGTFAEGGQIINKGLHIDYTLDLDHLTNIDFNDLMKWMENYKEDQHPLDVLYKLQSVSNYIGG
eukprot:TRINITY_DN29292_c0_g1_i1.p1 TRINITY_DN29292_c0_g1~~TRINITY_DN29292_c0_g1_i1.p1  ORF type:complete len:233 (-),score=20.57 TRINITY_DN29292_c0_g1_i1:186-809(-)